jgi:hypothetical protein
LTARDGVGPGGRVCECWWAPCDVPVARDNAAAARMLRTVGEEKPISKLVRRAGFLEPLPGGAGSLDTEPILVIGAAGHSQISG